MMEKTLKTTYYGARAKQKVVQKNAGSLTQVARITVEVWINPTGYSQPRNNAATYPYISRKSLGFVRNGRIL